MQSTILILREGLLFYRAYLFIFGRLSYVTVLVSSQKTKKQNVITPVWFFPTRTLNRNTIDFLNWYKSKRYGILLVNVHKAISCWHPTMHTPLRLDAYLCRPSFTASWCVSPVDTSRTVKIVKFLLKKEFMIFRNHFLSKYIQKLSRKSFFTFCSVTTYICVNKNKCRIFHTRA